VSGLLRLNSSVPEGTYIELVRSLFRTVLTSAIMAVSFLGIAVLVCLAGHDRWLTSLSVLAMIAMAARILVLLLLRNRAFDEGLDMTSAKRIERMFASSYLGFALVFGLFAARAFIVASADLHAILIGLIVGYAAGVAATISFRPWIAVPSVLLGVVPTISAAFASSNPFHWALGLFLLVFMAGGIQNITARYSNAAAGISMRRLFANLARKDGLTDLPNRLAMAETFNKITTRGGNRSDLAVHCLDLDRFKPVNDWYGHPVGDLLLQAVAERLRGMLRNSDFAARVGGDEFVVLQQGIADAGEADLLSRRIVRTLAEPFLLGELTVTIGASVGSALSSEYGYDLERLITGADHALLLSKSARATTAQRLAPHR
jgi:diguanylate cyclase (GGDEF)-like protein